MDHPLSISKELVKILRIVCVLFTAVLVFFILTSTNKASATTDSGWWNPTMQLPQYIVDNYAYSGTDEELKTAIADGKQVLITKLNSGNCLIFIAPYTTTTYSLDVESPTTIRLNYTGGGSSKFSNGTQSCTDTGGSTNTSYTNRSSSSTSISSFSLYDIEYFVLFNKSFGSISYYEEFTGYKATAEEFGHRIAGYTEPDPEYDDPDIWIGDFGLARQPQWDNPRPECRDPKGSGRTWLSAAENAFGRQESLRQVIFGEVEGGWAAAQVVQPNGTKFVRIYYWHGTANLEWTEPNETDTKGRVRILTNGITNRGSYWLQVSCNQFNDHPIGINITNPAWNSGQHATISAGYHQDHRTGIIFVSGSYNPNYPDGYTGQQIPNEAPREYDGNRAYAKYDAITDSFSLKATYNGNEYDDSRCTYLTWRSVLVEDPEQGYNPTETEFVYKKLGETYETVVGETGFFRLDLEWGWASTTTDFEKAGLNPSNLSYCQEQVLAGSGPISQAYNQGLLPANYGKVMPIDGLNGESFDEANPNKTCQWEDQPFVETGFYPAYLCIYETSWTLKDCSVYGIEDLGSLIGCHIGNFFNTLRHLFQKYFIPRPAKIQNSVANLSDSLMENSSFLTYPLAFILNIVEDVSTAEPSCTINVNDIYGASASWNLCSVKNSFPAMWTMATTVFRMGLTILFIVSVWRGFLNMFALNNKQ